MKDKDFTASDILNAIADVLKACEFSTPGIKTTDENYSTSIVDQMVKLEKALRDKAHHISKL